MLFRRLAGVLVLSSFACSVSAQTVPPKSKPGAKKPAASAKAPAKKADSAAPPVVTPPPPTDVQVRTRYVTGAQVSENTTYMKGARQRFEFPGITMIAQCDLNRSLQLHDGTKQYLIIPSEPSAGGASVASPSSPDAGMAAQVAAISAVGGGAPPAARPKGDVIAETVTMTDTGERKQMFGFEARRIKVAVARSPGENACETTATRVETDGWYTDLPDHASCPGLPSPAPLPPPAGQQACTDRVVTRQIGDARLGFALSTETTTTVVDRSAKEKDQERDKEVTTTSMEVTDLKVTTLDSGLFDVPPGYTQVNDYKSLLPSLTTGGSLADAIFGSIADGTSSVAPKKNDVIRVGVVMPANKSGKELPDLRLIGGLLAGFTKAPFESVPVSGATAADLDRDSASKGCDYVLVSDISEFKTSKPNKVGGLLKKVSGDTSGATEIYDVRVDYRLFAVGDPGKPRLSSSAKASSGGGFGIRSAFKLAAFAGQMYLTMGMGGGMMGMLGQGPAFGGMGGLGSGLMTGRMNPSMGAAMSIMAAGSSMAMAGGMAGMADAKGHKAMETLQEALARTGKQVTDELKKTKPAAASAKR